MRDLHAIKGHGGGGPDLVCKRTMATKDCAVSIRDWRDYMMLNLEAHVARCRAIGAITSDQSEAILEIFTDHAAVCIDVPARLLHGDLGNHNIFVQNNAVVALIDWEDALIGDPAFDVAMWLTFHPPCRHAAFLQGYGPDRAGRWVSIAMRVVVPADRFVENRTPASFRLPGFTRASTRLRTDSPRYDCGQPRCWKGRKVLLFA